MALLYAFSFDFTNSHGCLSFSKRFNFDSVSTDDLLKQQQKYSATAEKSLEVLIMTPLVYERNLSNAAILPKNRRRW